MDSDVTIVERGVRVCPSDNDVTEILDVTKTSDLKTKNKISGSKTKIKTPNENHIIYMIGK